MINTMIEWDDHIPEFEVLEAELGKAKQAAKTASEYGDLPIFVNSLPPRISNQPADYAAHQHRVQKALLERDDYDSKPDEWIRPKPDFAPGDQLQVYINAYHWRLEGVVREDYPALCYYLGEEISDKLFEDYVLQTPSTWFNASHYISPFPAFVAKYFPEDVFAHELTQLETALALVFHETETEALTPAHIEEMTPDVLMSSHLYPRKASRLLAFTAPVNMYFKAVMEEQSPEKPTPEASYVAIFRHEDIVWRLDLEAAEYALLALLAEGKAVGEALEELIVGQGIAEAELLGNLQTWFARWMRNGLLANTIKTERKHAA